MVSCRNLVQPCQTAKNGCASAGWRRQDWKQPTETTADLSRHHQVFLTFSDCKFASRQPLQGFTAFHDTESPHQVAVARPAINAFGILCPLILPRISTSSELQWSEPETDHPITVFMSILKTIDNSDQSYNFDLESTHGTISVQCLFLFIVGRHLYLFAYPANAGKRIIWPLCARSNQALH
jgi:hypothetical protein